jgi:hypothetical protein
MSWSSLLSAFHSLPSIFGLRPKMEPWGVHIFSKSLFFTAKNGLSHRASDIYSDFFEPSDKP